MCQHRKTSVVFFHSRIKRDQRGWVRFWKMKLVFPGMHRATFKRKRSGHLRRREQSHGEVPRRPGRIDPATGRDVANENELDFDLQLKPNSGFFKDSRPRFRYAVVHLRPPTWHPKDLRHHEKDRRGPEISKQGEKSVRTEGEILRGKWIGGV